MSYIKRNYVDEIVDRYLNTSDTVVDIAKDLNIPVSDVIAVAMNLNKEEK